MTQQETEEWSHFVSDDNYVQRQKEDIQELTSLFRDMMENEGADSTEEYLADFQRVFKPQAGFTAEYSIHIDEKPANLILSVKGPKLECKYGTASQPTVEVQVNRATMEEIVNGRMTFQRAFMSGVMKMKGDFRVMRSLDQIFEFGSNENGE